MASTYSTNLAIELIGTGEQSGTWGTTTNTNLGTLIEQSISGYVTQAITDGSGANTTITIPNGTTGVARNMYIEMTGALSFSTTSLIVPANKKLYFIFNNTSGGFAVTVKVSGQTGVLVPNGKKVILTSNGTDIVEAANQVVGAFGVGGTATMAAINASGAITATPSISIGSTANEWTGAPSAVNPLIQSNGTTSYGTISAASSRADGTSLRIGSFTGEYQTNSATHKTIGVMDFVTTGTTANQRGGGWNLSLKADGSTSTTTVISATVAGGVSVTGTLGVTGLSTLGTDGLLSLTTKGYFNSKYNAAASLWQWGPGAISTANAFGFTVGGTNVLDLLSGSVAVTGTLGVTGAITGTTGTFTKAAAGDVLVLTNGGATPKPMYFYSDASTMSMGTSASQNGSLLGFVGTTSAQINISGGSVQSWTTAGTSVTGTLDVTGTSGYGPRATASSTDRISVSTTATTLSALTTGGSVGATVALFIVNGYNTGGAGNSFCDIVAFVSGAAATTISATAKGSPAARTYSASSNLFQLAMASGTYNVAVTRFEQSC